MKVSSSNIHLNTVRGEGVSERAVGRAVAARLRTIETDYNTTSMLYYFTFEIKKTDMFFIFPKKLVNCGHNFKVKVFVLAGFFFNNVKF